LTNKVNKLQTGPSLPTISSDLTLVWDFIAKWGGNWMWEGTDATQQTKTDTTWIAKGMKGGTLIGTTDGLYDRKRVNNLYGVDWIIFCKKTGLRLTGSFWERSLTASSFQAEMFSLCALHLLVCAITEFHGVNKWTATMSCNNKQTLSLSSHHKGRIQPSAKCADITRNFCSTKQTYKGSFNYVYVYGHMDQHLPWN
jgi:hypothetical protein